MKTMTLNDLIAALPPTGLALLEMALEEAAECTTAGDEDRLMTLYRAKTKTVNAGVALWGQDYHELVWAIGMAVDHAVSDAPVLNQAAENDDGEVDDDACYQREDGFSYEQIAAWGAR